MRSTGWHAGEIGFDSPKEQIPVPIVADAAVASVQTKGGLLVPVLLIDTSSRPDIENLIRFHMLQSSGECKSIWAHLDPNEMNAINLILQFLSPSKCSIVLEFDILKQGGIVDHIVQAEALYLYPARPGERFKDDMTRESILVEVPSERFAAEWDRMFDSALQEEGRRSGLSKKQAQEYAQEVKKDWRRISKGLSK